MSAQQLTPKQSLINLLIDSPLREIIKINLIDIVNNTQEAELNKVVSTINKELEIYQKATNRKLKVATEITQKIAQLFPSQPTPTQTSPTTPSTPPTPPASPTPPTPPAHPEPQLKNKTPQIDTKLSVPPLKLPPLPKTNPTPPANAPTKPSTPPTPPVPPIPPTPPAPPAPPTPPTPPTPQPEAKTQSELNDEDALKAIQKELEALKTN